LDTAAHRSGLFFSFAYPALAESSWKKASLASSAGNIISTRSSDAVTSTAESNRITEEIVRTTRWPMRSRDDTTGTS
jgi:hypothetical protein